VLFHACPCGAVSLCLSLSPASLVSWVTRLSRPGRRVIKSHKMAALISGFSCHDWPHQRRTTGRKTSLEVRAAGKLIFLGLVDRLGCELACFNRHNQLIRGHAGRSR
jgi:hypothetical protein